MSIIKYKYVYLHTYIHTYMDIYILQKTTGDFTTGQ